VVSMEDDPCYKERTHSPDRLRLDRSAIAQNYRRVGGDCQASPSRAL